MWSDIHENKKLHAIVGSEIVNTTEEQDLEVRKQETKQNNNNRTHQMLKSIGRMNTESSR